MGARPTIRLYDTLSREKQVLSPIREGRVGMYVCGPTVYDRAHIGNARPVIVFDVLFRLLNHVYGAENVTYVRNFTDIDDKIMTRAAETGESIAAITEQTIGWYHEDMDAVGALRPTLEPRATAHVPEMIATIEALIANGSAYEAEGHVLFAVKSYAGYGQLSRRSLDDMIAGARVDVAPYKRDPMDFVLWKPSSADQPGWESPWGRGRPGWHIECSAMSEKCLGVDFDIHGGGIDLTFPHHENERAQSLCAHPGSQYASIWMHNGFVQVEGEKMSKSLGNFITVHDLEASVPGEVIRLAMLMTHYRQPFDWTATLAVEARTVLEKWAKLFMSPQKGGDPSFVGQPPKGEPDDEFVAALVDDLNTPLAIARLHKLYRLATTGDHAQRNIYRTSFYHSAGLLGFDLRAIDFQDSAQIRAALRYFSKEQSQQDYAYLSAKRSEARKEKDFQTSDDIRDGLHDAGILIKDTPNGVEFEVQEDFDPDRLAELAARYRK